MEWDLGLFLDLSSLTRPEDFFFYFRKFVLFFFGIPLIVPPPFQRRCRWKHDLHRHTYIEQLGLRLHLYIFPQLLQVLLLFHQLCFLLLYSTNFLHIIKVKFQYICCNLVSLVAYIETRSPVNSTGDSIIKQIT